MFAKLKELFFGKPAEKPVETMAPAPYKIETPSANWPFPKASETAPENHVRVEAPAPAPALTVDGHGDVHEVKPAKKSAAKKTAAKPAAAKKPAVKKAPAKKKSAE
jgi:hypothetical protein